MSAEGEGCVIGQPLLGYGARVPACEHGFHSDGIHSALFTLESIEIKHRAELILNAFHPKTTESEVIDTIVSPKCRCV